MSQNKTRFPGMEQARESTASRSSIYSREGFQPQDEGQPQEGRKTRYPGMESGPAHSSQQPVYGKPIRGFLYSISRNTVGEFWPLRIGKNTIGSSPKCDICLSEATVSENHASITVRVLENQEKTIASLKDTDSTNGTKINGEDVDFDANKLQNGDIIRFGTNYECLLILIDTKETGLKVSEGFIPSETDAFASEEDSAPILYQRSENPSARGTVAMDGTPTVDDNRHHTVSM
jgi:pSer/pThr/pTyr-binding forkhead associated (FHA) protein